MWFVSTPFYATWRGIALVARAIRGLLFSPPVLNIHEASVLTDTIQLAEAGQYVSRDLI